MIAVSLMPEYDDFMSIFLAYIFMLLAKRGSDPLANESAEMINPEELLE